MIDIFENWSTEKVNQTAPLKLAYIGDAVYEILVRRYLLESFPGNVNKIHKEATRYAKAEGQAGSLRKIEELLTEEEKNIVRRGRNSKSGTIPKNAKLQDYKYATGYEALIGYLYLLKRHERINYLFTQTLKCEVIENENESRTS